MVQSSQCWVQKLDMQTFLIFYTHLSNHWQGKNQYVIFFPPLIHLIATHGSPFCPNLYSKFQTTFPTMGTFNKYLGWLRVFLAYYCVRLLILNKTVHIWHKDIIANFSTFFIFGRQRLKFFVYVETLWWFSRQVNAQSNTAVRSEFSVTQPFGPCREVEV